MQPMLRPGLTGDNKKALSSSDKLFISLSFFVFILIQRKELLACFDQGQLCLLSYFNPQQQRQLAFRQKCSGLEDYSHSCIHVVIYEHRISQDSMQTNASDGRFELFVSIHVTSLLCRRTLTTWVIHPARNCGYK